MQKSSKFKFCLLSLPLLLVAVAAAGCGKDNHTHTYSSEEWAFNAEAHWHPSTCSHDVKTNKSEHTFTDTVIPPSVTSAGYTLHTCACGYSYISDSVGSLPIETELHYNEDGHWKPVLSGGRVEVEEHEYTETTIAPTCSTAGYKKYACECGYWYAKDPTDPIVHTYDENVWGHDEDGHWHPALCCTAKSGSVAHDYTVSVTPASGSDDGYTEYTCKDCGYSYQVDAGHSFSDTLEGDEYVHWRPATCAHTTEKADVADHVLVGTSNVCKVCNKTVTTRLAYELSADKEYYIVTGKGSISDKAIVIPDTYREKEVREIADRAFEGEDITSVTIGANVTKIGTRAFENANLTAATLGASIEELGYRVFCGCEQLQTVQIQSSLTVLPPYTFEGCSSLKTVTCATPLAEIGAQAFLDCSELTTIDLSGCTKVGFSAFAGCSKLASVSLTSLKVAEEYAFSGCAIATVTLPATLTQVSNNLFNGCTKLTTVELSAESVGNSAFEGCVLLDTVTLNDGAQLIGSNAFKGCSALASLTLPDTVVRVGENAFTGTGLISTDGGVQYAANVVVGVNSGVTSVTVKAGTVGIADGAFRKNTTLNSVSLGSVRFIGVSALRECSKLTAITFTESVKIIGANAFRESGLTSVSVPATVETVGDNAFYDCKSLISVTVHAKEIGRFAFSYTGVNRTLNSPVKERPDYAKLTSITLGEEVEIIGSNAFQYCPVTSVTLPAGLTTIGKYAFAQTNLSSITIPASVTRIGEYAFYDCKSLTSVTFADTQNWKAGKISLNLDTASRNATYLKTTYLDIDWIKE